MDELEISGKRYISSKRIARENKYHPDYMGQLIRAGKISGTKVGRAWYVEEQSLAAYLGQERAAQIVSEPAQNFSSGSDEPGQSSTPASATAVVASNVAAEGAPQSDGSRTEQIPSKESAYPKAADVAADIPLVFVEKIFIPEVQPEIKKAEFKPTPTPSLRKPSLTYISDSSPLFPEITKRAPSQKIPVHKEENLPAVAVEIHPQIAPKRSLIKTSAAVVSLGLVAAVVLSVAFFGSLNINSTVLVEKGKPASVAFSKNETFCFIFGTCQND